MGFRLGGTCDPLNGEYLAQVQLECSSIDSRGSVRPFAMPWVSGFLTNNLS